MNILLLPLAASLALAVPGRAAPIVDFDSGSEDASLWFVHDGRGAGHHDGPRGVPSPGRTWNQQRVPERRDFERRYAPPREYRQYRPAPRHWNYHPQYRPWRWHGSWIRWWGWGTLWVAGAGLGTCNVFYHERLSSCYGSCLEEANACRGYEPGAPECGANYAYCANSCQIEFASNYWSVCRIWVPPAPPLLDEPLPPGVAVPPSLYPEGVPYEETIPEPPPFQ